MFRVLPQLEFALLRRSHFALDEPHSPAGHVTVGMTTGTVVDQVVRPVFLGDGAYNAETSKVEFALLLTLEFQRQTAGSQLTHRHSTLAALTATVTRCHINAKDEKFNKKGRQLRGCARRWYA